MSPLRVVDFHSHYIGAAEGLVPSLEEAGVAARVISAPLEFLKDAEGINDSVADLVRRHPGRVYGLATVDAYAGEAAAAELVRAVRELGLRGVFMESAKGELLPDAPEARPTLAAESAERARLRQVYIDTTGMNRVAVRGSIAILGADHVLTGTDWPVVQEKGVPATLEAMFDELGLDADARRNIAGHNALRLLEVPSSNIARYP